MEVRKEEAAAAELEEVTWAPHISRMARHLRRPDSETELWSRLSKPAIHKNKARRCCLSHTSHCNLSHPPLMFLSCSSKVEIELQATSVPCALRGSSCSCSAL